MRGWKENGQRTVVSSMSDGDFFANEQSHIMAEAGSVKVYFKDVFAKQDDVLAQLKVNVNNGLGDLYKKIAGHPKKGKILADIEAVYASRPGLAMDKMEEVK